MARYQMGQRGRMFADGPINLSWGANREEGDVQEVTKEMARSSPGFLARVASGVIIQTERAATKPPKESDLREYKILEGEEARKVMDEPAGPVMRQVFDPVSRQVVHVELASVQTQQEALVAAEAEKDAAEAEGDEVVDQDGTVIEDAEDDASTSQEAPTTETESAPLVSSAPRTTASTKSSRKS